MPAVASDPVEKPKRAKSGRTDRRKCPIRRKIIGVSPLTDQNTVQPLTEAHRSSLVGRAIFWLSPWSARRYPGLRVIGLGLLDFRVTWRAVLNWRSGFRPFPAWAARAWADAMESRCMTGLALVAELRAHAHKMDAKPRKLAGFCAPGASWNFGKGAVKKPVGGQK